MRTQYVYYRNISPFAVIGFVLLALAFFFLALPIFLAALAVFSGVAAYMAWRIRRAVSRIEKECMERDAGKCNVHVDDPRIIDITPSEDSRFP